MTDIKFYISAISKVVELIGVITIFIGILYSLAIFIARINKSNSVSFDNLRQTLGKSILLGLEILIAADIMATVATDPTLQSVIVLGVIVLIRTLLSFSLQIEIDGKLPWQKAETAQSKKE
ncbi:MAG TPA: DUF1622 domain-containing protein [Chitinophagales bacterium]|nr:DUF1622 domain-containing protein [Chitinophagales bacterium]HNL84837.1 DUF1622 domain-containing protein [Chitinophagales bacterium]